MNFSGGSSSTSIGPLSFGDAKDKEKIVKKYEALVEKVHKITEELDESKREAK